MAKEVVTQAAQVPAIPDVYKFMAMANHDIIKENVGESGLNPYDLDRVKFPAGGSIAWSVPTLSGEMDIAKSIEGIIVDWRDTRSYWDSEYTGEATPPICASVDGDNGLGMPGGKCSMCPMSKWGSGKNGGQACKAARLLFVMTQDSILPLVVPVPPTSVGIMKQFFMRMAGKEISYYGCRVSLGLEEAKNKGGIKYSQIKPAFLKALSEEQVVSVRAYANTLKGTLNRVVLDHEDIAA